MTETTCAFTGHRPKSFPWKYNEAAPDCVLLKEVLAKQIKLLAVYDGTHRSGTGMTARYAQKQGREIIVIDPITKAVNSK